MHFMFTIKVKRLAERMSALFHLFEEKLVNGCIRRNAKMGTPFTSPVFQRLPGEIY